MSDNQPKLFDTEPAPWEFDDASMHRVASIVLPTGPPGPFDYVVPTHLTELAEPGRRVKVPFGRGDRTVVGYCVGIEDRPVAGRRLKQLKTVLDSRQLITTSMLAMTRWMSEHYLCSWGAVLEAVVPAAVRSRAGTREVTLLSVPNNVVARLTQLKLPRKQARALRCLASSSTPLTPKQLAEAAECTLAPIQGLRAKGLVVSETERRTQGEQEEVVVERTKPLDLNPQQQQALDAILDPLGARQHATILMHGVTGSGKTEVYIRAIEEVVSFGRQAIVLVPEISLTPQTCQRFRSRFDSVAVLHSNITDAHRHHQWSRIARGEVQVVVGARSAVFAPAPHLGLIVLDEEHDASFKQDIAPRYHARDVAQYRADTENVPLVLGSATPSLESWNRTESGAYKLVSLPNRVLDRPLPRVDAIDLRLEYRERKSRGAISRGLHQGMDDALRAGGQVILLLNRRGYSTHIQCPACGEVVVCPDCDIALTHHRHGEKAVCHYCDFATSPPNHCPKCNFEGIRYSGLGTQRLEAEVRSRFPNHECLRMDSDSMMRPGSHEKALDRFRAGEVHILLGTQMIAKGLDFPQVTLVGVINSDTALHFPDFRASERTFQLVTQVAGRTGRGDLGGRVLVQTFNPEHPAIQAALNHDYHAFAAYELPTRQEFGYPPYGYLIRFVVRGPSEAVTEQFAQHVADQLRERIAPAGKGYRVLGPSAAPIAKLRGRFRFHLLLQGPDGALLRSIAGEVSSELKPPTEVQWIVDVEPVEML